jgi:hypothetical protein
MAQNSIPGGDKAARELATRLDAMIDGPLQMPVTVGPVFVLLALATDHADLVRPESGACDAAAQALRRAEPGGYVISARTRRTAPPRTFGSEFPDRSVPRYAYVHVAERGMIEIVSGEIIDNAHGLVGFGAIEKSIREHDAEALRAAFVALGVDGPIMVAIALLRTRNTKVSFHGATSHRVGVLHVPYVKIEPFGFAARLELKAEKLNQSISDLWTAVTRQVSAVQNEEG